VSTDDKSDVDNFEWVTRFFSEERFSKYLAESPADYSRALVSYLRDLFALGELHVWINLLEVSLRNSIVRELQTSARLERTDWLQFLNQRLLPEGQRALTKAITRITNERRPLKNSSVVSELPLGFWVNLLKDSYETSLWTRSLHRAFPNLEPKTRKTAHRKISQIYKLRNRAAHQGLIYHEQLPSHRELISEVLVWISAEGHAWAKSAIKP
jgi:hypothetical protein